MMKKPTMILATVATLALASVAFAQQNSAAMKLKGKQLPAISLRTIDGKIINNASMKGKVTVIDFYASWCGPCMAAAPKLNKIFLDHRRKGLVVIGANAGETNAAGDPLSIAEYQKKTAAYQKEHGYAYTFATAADKAAETLKVAGFPSFYVIDKKGVLREVMVGFNEPKLRAVVKKLLAEK